MSRYNQIQQFINETDLVFEELSSLSDNSKSDRTISSLAIPKVSSLLNYLRTSLDYIAADIIEIIIIPSNTLSARISRQIFNNYHFPYGKDENSFRSRMEYRLPNLFSLNAALYNLIENIQLHKSGNMLIHDLCHFNNVTKHETSTQIRKNQNSVLIGGVPRISGNIIGLTLKNGTIDGKPFDAYIGDTSDESTVIDPEGVISLETTDVKYFFPNCNTDILTLLGDSKLIVRKLVDGIYSILPK
jgi:hypothetical protein